MSSKYKKRSRNNRSSLVKAVRLVKDSKQPKIITTAISREFNLSDTDKITYTKAVDQNNNILEVVNVSYEVRINEEWMTIWRYDSEHGYLNCHMRVSLSNTAETVTTASVKKKGTPHGWFTWAIDNIKKNYLNYRRGFFKRSKIIDNVY